MSDISAAVKIEDISSVKKKLSFDIPWADVKTELESVYRKVGKKAKIKGFRPGKVPRAMLEKYYRQDAEEETLSNLINRYYWEALKEKEIPAVTQPQIDQQGFEAEKDFSFSATVEVEPKLEARDYTGLELQKETPEVTDAELAARMEEIRQMFATMEEVKEERGVRSGDFVTIDFTGTLAGERLKELSAENHTLEIGSKSFVPGFEDQLIDQRVGETRTVAVRFPYDYRAAHLAGREVEFTVVLKAIREKKLPEIDEEFVKNFERYESLDALRAEVRSSLAEEKGRRIAMQIEKQIGERLLEKNLFEVPESFVERQVYYMMADTQRRMAANGMDPKKAAELSRNLRDHYRNEATTIVKTALLLKAIAEAEAIRADEGEVEGRVREIAAGRGQEYATLRKSFDEDGTIDDIRSEITNRKTYAFLEASARVTTVTPEKN